MKLSFLGTRGYIEPCSRRHRMHTATLVAYRGRRVMIDCGASWRDRIGEVRPHAIVLTHAHPDHAFGLDRGAPCPVHAMPETWERIERFPIPRARRRRLSPRREVGIEGVRFEPFPVLHSVRAPAVGYRIRAGRVAVFYVPDVVSIPDRGEAFRDIRVYVGDGATVTRNMVRRHRERGEPFGHADIRRQLGWCAAEGVLRMIVTHCGSDIVGGDERRVGARIRALAAERGVRVEIAHDGMQRVLRCAALRDGTPLAVQRSMPELADVEGWRRYVARYARGRRVRAVRVRDDAVLRNTSPQGLGRALKDAHIGDPERRGKWLILPVDSGHLVLHFGMTGALAWTGRPDENAPGDADRVVFALDGGELRYQSWRKFGGVWWVPPREDVASVTGPLGPDAADLSLAGLRELLGGRRGGIKSALMDQTLLAGIGNELSDEILWLARLSPRRRVDDLSRDDVARLHRALTGVLRRSIAHGRIPTRGRWLQAVRDDEAPACPRCGARLRRTKAAGRSAIWCPRCQR